MRRAACIGDDGVRSLLSTYLDDDRLLDSWVQRLNRRRRESAWMNLSQLAGTGRQPGSPLQVALPGNGVLNIVRWLRILPGHRYVGCAEWNGRTVLAKLIVGSKRSVIISSSEVARG